MHCIIFNCNCFLNDYWLMKMICMIVITTCIYLLDYLKIIVLTFLGMKRIKHLRSILSTFFTSHLFPVPRDGNFLFYVKVTFTWFADNLCTSNFCSVILSGELDFGARIVEDLTLGKWESFLLARSSVCTFFGNSFNGNKP